MGERDLVTRVGPGERTPGDPTPGMVREQAVAVDGMWAGLVRTEPRTVSGWHHHGDHDTTVYVVEGTVRLECGPGGTTVVDAGPGDFLHVPRGAVHRESNPGDAPSAAVVVRAGEGPPTVNVEEPAAG